MSRKKQLEAYEAETQYSFDMVKKDVLFLFNVIESQKKATDERFSTLERGLKSVIREIRRTHKRGRITGDIYPTLAGKVKALAEHAGIEFGVEPRVVKPTKVVAQKKAKK